MRPNRAERSLEDVFEQVNSINCARIWVFFLKKIIGHFLFVLLGSPCSCLMRLSSFSSSSGRSWPPFSSGRIPSRTEGPSRWPLLRSPPPTAPTMPSVRASKTCSWLESSIGIFLFFPDDLNPFTDREQMSLHPVNRAAFHLLDTAAFILCLVSTEEALKHNRKRVFAALGFVGLY